MTKQTDIEALSSVDTLKLKDYFLSQESFSLVKNTSFGFLETTPQPSLENLDKYYESENYISHTDASKSLFEKVYQIIKNYNIRYKFSLLSNKSTSKKLLDYGCGTGEFLAYAQKKKILIYGIEPNNNARTIAEKKVGKKNIGATEIQSISEQFDYITLWHVLEHIPNLFEFIKELKSHLKDDGQLLIAVPNHKSYDAKFYKQFWAAYDVPRHLWHFSPESLEKLFFSFGMKIEKRKPLWFDSYYVSILSEKYKQSKIGIVRAVWVATLSNLFALFDGNFSSLIYIIRKSPQ
ncbi:MAG: class I SAM-dependent methyltransferase [Moheibacter sp.]